MVKKIKKPRKLGFVRFVWDSYRQKTGMCPSAGGVSFVDIVRVVYGKELSRKDAREFLIDAWSASNMGAGEPKPERSKICPHAAKKHITRRRKSKADSKDFSCIPCHPVYPDHTNTGETQMANPNKAFSSMNGGRGPVRALSTEDEARRMERVMADPCVQVMQRVRAGELSPDEGAEEVRRLLGLA